MLQSAAEMEYRCAVSFEQIIGFALALSIMLCGTVGSVLPALPGTPLLVVAAIGHRLYFGPQGASTWVLLVLLVLMIGSMVLDYFATVLGAKKLGATWRGALGAILGGLIGLFFSLPGIILGPFIGAMLLELAGGREFKPSARAGLGATLGLVLSSAGKLLICLLMISLFAANVIYRSVS